ncbi:MAG: glycosyltransferase [Rhodospirillaceae bacterium]|nr:glycosyltransferase [Rhodospirillaceae bacterium]
MPRARRIAFVLGGVYLPDDLTGANISLHALCRRLARLGFEPTIICAGKTGDPSPDSDYAVARFADPVAALPAALARLRPDRVVLRAPDPAARLLAHRDWLDRPLHVYLESGFAGHGFPSPRECPHLRYGANSPFLARLGEAYFAAPVAMVPPVIEPDDYRVRARGDAILFVNPIAIKGAHIAAKIAARLPDRRFVFARAWSDEGRHPPILPRRSNVEIAERCDDMRPLYRRTKLLLVPSVWEESSARVVGEAQIGGIPAIVSNRGGLADSVGAGGIVVPYDAPIARWCEAIETMFRDEARYAGFRRAAHAHAKRPDFMPDGAVARFLEFCGLDSGPRRTGSVKRNRPRP